MAVRLGRWWQQEKAVSVTAYSQSTVAFLVFYHPRARPARVATISGTLHDTNSTLSSISRRPRGQEPGDHLSHCQETLDRGWVVFEWQCMTETEQHQSVWQPTSDGSKIFLLSVSEAVNSEAVIVIADLSRPGAGRRHGAGGHWGWRHWPG